MSAVLIRAALETALAAMTPSLPTAYENAPFSVPADAPYQRCNVLMAQPAMQEMSQRIAREQGFMQVTLCYPLDAGSADAMERAELIRDTFTARSTFSHGGVTVHVDGLPEILPASNEPDRYVVPVRVRFYAYVTRS